jgi:hypothetical protein
VRIRRVKEYLKPRSCWSIEQAIVLQEGNGANRRERAVNTEDRCLVSGGCNSGCRGRKLRLPPPWRRPVSWHRSHLASLGWGPLSVRLTARELVS